MNDDEKLAKEVFDMIAYGKRIELTKEEKEEIENYKENIDFFDDMLERKRIPKSMKFHYRLSYYKYESDGFCGFSSMFPYFCRINVDDENGKKIKLDIEEWIERIWKEWCFSKNVTYRFPRFIFKNTGRCNVLISNFKNKDAYDKLRRECGNINYLELKVIIYVPDKKEIKSYRPHVIIEDVSSP